jgi:Mrp family chromosome partitioning ATPase
LALGLASMGYEVGLMDLVYIIFTKKDLCGPSIPRMMGIEGREVH